MLVQRYSLIDRTIPSGGHEAVTKLIFQASNQGAGI